MQFKINLNATNNLLINIKLFDQYMYFKKLSFSN